jgi:hypothetical protein
MGNIDVRPLGWFLIGPVDIDVPLGILDNSLRSDRFNSSTPARTGIPANLGLPYSAIK